MTPRARSTATSESSRLRATTGINFEHDLDITHAEWRFRKYGIIRKNYLPSKIVGKDDRGVRLVRTGPADIDRSGWVSISKHFVGTDDEVWRPISRYAAPLDQLAGVGPIILPVAIEAKVQKADHATYVHEPDRIHQLQTLKAAADDGEYAFLLVYAPAVERVFAIPILNHFNELISGRGVTLWEKRRWAAAPGGFITEPLLPSIPKRVGSIGCDWLPLLPHCEPWPAKR